MIKQRLRVFMGSVDMTPEEFKKWRKSLNLKQKDAANYLGLRKRMIQYYENGKRNGTDVTIPRSVALACFALNQGIVAFDGKTAQKDEELINLVKKQGD